MAQVQGQEIHCNSRCAPRSEPLTLDELLGDKGALDCENRRDDQERELTMFRFFFGVVQRQVKYVQGRMVAANRP
jgi:hypothetical protein